MAVDKSQLEDNVMAKWEERVDLDMSAKLGSFWGADA